MKANRALESVKLISWPANKRNALKTLEMLSSSFHFFADLKEWRTKIHGKAAWEKAVKRIKSRKN